MHLACVALNHCALCPYLRLCMVFAAFVSMLRVPAALISAHPVQPHLHAPKSSTATPAPSHPCALSMQEETGRQTAMETEAEAARYPENDSYPALKRRAREGGGPGPPSPRHPAARPARHCWRTPPPSGAICRRRKGGGPEGGGGWTEATVTRSDGHRATWAGPVRIPARPPTYRPARPPACLTTSLPKEGERERAARQRREREEC